MIENDINTSKSREVALRRNKTNLQVGMQKDHDHAREDLQARPVSEAGMAAIHAWVACIGTSE
jgi:hypothetical protein